MKVFLITSHLFDYDVSCIILCFSDTQMLEYDNKVTMWLK